jgi:hypothetical protein
MEDRWAFEEFATAESAKYRLSELNDDPCVIVTVDHNMESQGGILKGTDLIKWLVGNGFKGAIVSVTGDPGESATHISCGAKCAWGKPFLKGGIHTDVARLLSKRDPLQLEKSPLSPSKQSKLEQLDAPLP